MTVTAFLTRFFSLKDPFAVSAATAGLLHERANQRLLRDTRQRLELVAQQLQLLTYPSLKDESGSHD